MAPLTDRRGLLQALVKDGRPLIVLTALALLFSGGFALFLSAGARGGWRGRFSLRDQRPLLGRLHERLSHRAGNFRRGAVRRRYHAERAPHAPVRAPTELIQVFRFDDRGKIVEQWDVLQRVGDCGKRQAAAVERTGVTWSSRMSLIAHEARRRSCWCSRSGGYSRWRTWCRRSRQRARCWLYSPCWYGLRRHFSCSWS